MTHPFKIREVNYVQPYRPNFQYDPQQIFWLTRYLSELMGGYGYQLLETPLIEAADLFLTKAGDQVIKKLFTFERHGQELALRPEFTAPAAYYYVTRPELQDTIARWQFNGMVFEDIPGDIRHNPQRFSIGAELIGICSPAADAEILGMAMHGLHTLAVADPLLVIGHAGLTRQGLVRFSLDSRTERFLLKHLPTLKDAGSAYLKDLLEMALFTSDLSYDTGLETQYIVNDESHVYEVLNRLLDGSRKGAAMGGRTREDIAERLLRKRKRAAERAQVEAALEWLDQWVQIDSHSGEAFAAINAMIGTDPEAQQTLDEWRTVVELLTAYNIAPDQIRIQPGLARSWEYYTGIVFELRSNKGTHVGGGGRYDELARLIGSNRDVPAVGFAYYVDKMIQNLGYPQPANDSPVVFVHAPATHLVAAAQWAYQLRLRSKTVVLMLKDPVAETPVIYIEDGGARFGDKIYMLSQVDSLLSELNEVSNAQ
jgi:histidyl-tRNA synthetase